MFENIENLENVEHSMDLFVVPEYLPFNEQKQYTAPFFISPRFQQQNVDYTPNHPQLKYDYLWSPIKEVIPSISTLPILPHAPLMNTQQTKPPQHPIETFSVTNNTNKVDKLYREQQYRQRDSFRNRIALIEQNLNRWLIGRNLYGIRIGEYEEEVVDSIDTMIFSVDELFFGFGLELRFHRVLLKIYKRAKRDKFTFWKSADAMKKMKGRSYDECLMYYRDVMYRKIHEYVVFLQTHVEGHKCEVFIENILDIFHDMQTKPDASHTAGMETATTVPL